MPRSRAVVRFAPRAQFERQGVLLVLGVFAVLMAFYLVKPAREALLASAQSEIHGSELRAMANLGQGIVAFLVAVLYSGLADRWSRRHLVLIVNSAFASLLVGIGFLSLYIDSFHAIGIILAVYIGTGTVGVLIIAQAWTFATDVRGARAEHLLPVLSMAATMGGVAGAGVARLIVGNIATPAFALFIAAAAVLCAAAACCAAADEDAVAAGLDGDGAQRAPDGTLCLMRRHRYLAGAAAVALLTQWVTANGENLLFGFVQASAGDGAGQSATIEFYASFSLWSNLGALAVQLAVMCGYARSRSSADMLLVLPFVALVSAAAMLLVPVLGAVKVLKVAENATRHSVHNTATQSLWLPATAAMKYKVKIAIETMVVRLADLLAALTVFIGVRWMQASQQDLYVFNVLLVIAWLIAATLLVREQRQCRKRAGVISLRGAGSCSPPSGERSYRLAA